MEDMCSYIGEQFKDEKVQTIIDFWTKRTNSFMSIDEESAQTAADLIYAQNGLTAPKICYWGSPVSMMLASETIRRSRACVEHSYGKEIINISNEYQEWVSEISSAELKKSRSTYNSKLLNGMNSLRFDWYPTLNLDTLRFVDGWLTEYYPRFFDRSCDLVCFHALHGALEPNEKLYSENMLSNDTRKFNIFMAPEQCLYFAKQDIVAHILNLEIPESSEIGFRLLARSCHNAFLTTNQFWVCNSARTIHRNKDNEIECLRGPAIKFCDDSELHAVNGFPVPESFITDDMNLEQIPFNCSMREAFLRCYGVKNFLIDSKAVCVDQDNGRRLWNLVHDSANEVRSIMEVDGSVVDCYEGSGMHYYESFKQVKTFAEFGESLDKNMSFTITNHILPSIRD